MTLNYKIRREIEKFRRKQFSNVTVSTIIIRTYDLIYKRFKNVMDIPNYIQRLFIDDDNAGTL